MSKMYTIKMDNYLYERACAPIRTKDQIILLLLESISLLLVDQSGGVTYSKNQNGSITFLIDKMSRLIFKIENKIFTFNFPFFMGIGEDRRVNMIKDPELDIDIDAIVISILLSFFNKGFYHKSCFEEYFYDFDEFMGDKYLYDEISKELYPLDDIWNLINKLMKFEDGYLRYDCDEEHKNERYHPVHHIDIFYSSSNTFKIGLTNKVTVEEFVEIIDNQQIRPTVK